MRIPTRPKSVSKTPGWVPGTTPPSSSGSYGMLLSYVPTRLPERPNSGAVL